MRYARLIDGQPQFVVGAFSATITVIDLVEVDLDDFEPQSVERTFQYPDAWFDTASPDDLATVGITAIADPAPPADGQQVASETLTYDGAAYTITQTFEPVAVPYQIQNMQARMALSRGGELAAVNAGVAAAGGEISIYWEYTVDFYRDHPVLAQMATALGWTSDQLDALFRTAAAIT